MINLYNKFEIASIWHIIRLYVIITIYNVGTV